MKKNSIYMSIVLVGIVCAFVYMVSNKNSTQLQQASKAQTSSQEAEITLHPIVVERASFGYPVGYERFDRPKITTTKTLGALVLYKGTEDNKNFFLGRPTAQKEPPTTITLDVYTNEKNLSVKELLKKDSVYPIIQETIKPFVLDGKSGEYFEWDGLYRGRSVAVTYQGVTYIFSVTSLSLEDSILKDFEILLKTVRFN